MATTLLFSLLLWIPGSIYVWRSVCLFFSRFSCCNRYRDKHRTTADELLCFSAIKPLSTNAAIRLQCGRARRACRAPAWPQPRRAPPSPAAPRPRSSSPAALGSQRTRAAASCCATVPCDCNMGRRQPSACWRIYFALMLFECIARCTAWGIAAVVVTGWCGPLLLYVSHIASACVMCVCVFLREAVSVFQRRTRFRIRQDSCAQHSLAALAL